VTNAESLTDVYRGVGSSWLMLCEAIENVRLFDEIQDKSKQPAEASECKSQFVATAISRPGRRASLQLS
jgi:hypothetical protein